MPLITINSRLTSSLEKDEVFPDVLDSFTPSGLITVSYGSGRDVTMGNTLKVSETQSVPEIHVTFSPDGSETAQISGEATYTLVLTDPDAPSRTKKDFSEYAHHIVSGLKLSGKPEDFAAAIDFSNGHELLSYEGPGPPPKTGLHRYVYILFKETKGEPKYEGPRFCFGTGVPGSGIRAYAAKYGLVPVAVNFFFAQNEQQ